MNITEYLTTLGFTRVEQSDNEGRFLDPDYLSLQGLYAELHDDGMFFMWVDPFNVLLKINIKDVCESVVLFESLRIIRNTSTRVPIIC